MHDSLPTPPSAIGAAAATSGRCEPWIIVPAFNESLRLGEALDSLCRSFRHVVVVDDGSDDATAEVSRRYPVYYLRHVINRGQGAAIRTGLDFALAHGAETLVTFDADGQHAVDDIEGLVDPIRSGTADVALGSRFLGKSVGMPLSRRLVLKLGVVFTRLVSHVKVTDTHNGLRAFSHEAARRIRITEDRMAHASQILDEIYRCGLRYVEVPVTVAYSAATLDKGQRSASALRTAAQFFRGRIFR